MNNNNNINNDDDFFDWAEWEKLTKERIKKRVDDLAFAAEEAALKNLPLTKYHHLATPIIAIDPDGFTRSYSSIAAFERRWDGLISDASIRRSLKTGKAVKGWKFFIKIKNNLGNEE